jgi:tyrosine-protein phosphatase YwqE
VLAHPERYQFISPEYLTGKLMPEGFKCQLNLLSLTGYYGLKIKQCADLYLKEGIYQFAGTDLHHSFHLEALRKMKQDEKISAKLSDYTFQNELLLLH